MYPGGQSQIVIRAAGRGNPSISFNDGVELSTSYLTSIDGQYQLSQKLSQPRAMASADFDEDGSPDLIGGYSVQEGVILSLYRGNVDSLYPNSPEAQKRRAQGCFTEDAFLPTANLFDLARELSVWHLAKQWAKSEPVYGAR